MHINPANQSPAAARRQGFWLVPPAVVTKIVSFDLSVCRAMGAAARSGEGTRRPGYIERAARRGTLPLKANTVAWCDLRVVRSHLLRVAM